MEESDSFHRQIPDRIYLLDIDDRSAVRRVEHSKEKGNVTIVLSCHVDGSIVLRVFNIGPSNRPQRLRTRNYAI